MIELKNIIDQWKEVDASDRDDEILMNEMSKKETEDNLRTTLLTTLDWSAGKDAKERMVHLISSGSCRNWRTSQCSKH
jgi:hypothetical protein